MPLGSELVCWPDSLSTGAQLLTGGLGSETGQQGQRVQQWRCGSFLAEISEGQNPTHPADGSSSSFSFVPSHFVILVLPAYF